MACFFFSQQAAKLRGSKRHKGFSLHTITQQPDSGTRTHQILAPHCLPLKTRTSLPTPNSRLPTLDSRLSQLSHHLVVPGFLPENLDEQIKQFGMSLLQKIWSLEKIFRHNGKKFCRIRCSILIDIGAVRSNLLYFTLH